MIVFVFSTSYKLSIEAKYYYVKGDYQQAYDLAKQAYKQSPYNMMAFSVKQQSEIILKLQALIQEAKRSYMQISDIVASGNIDNNDHIRIKFICEIIIDKFDRLNFPLLNKSFLYDEAKQYRDEFFKILSNIHIKVK